MLNPHLEPTIVREVAPFDIDGLAMPYPDFVARLYNYCRSLGFHKGRMMPSRAFCSDENQGLPIILLTQHFGVFPFNHGRVGGILAVGRHGPHAQHGDDLVIVQASHVGYDPGNGEYGTYRRARLTGDNRCASCGKLTHVIAPYLARYRFARDRIFLSRDDSDRCLVTVKNSFVDFGSCPVAHGFVLRLPNMVDPDAQGLIRPIAAASATQTYEISADFKRRLEAGGHVWKTGRGAPIGELLTADLFFFREKFHATDDALLLERNLIEFMPAIVSARYPALEAAKTNIQLEFARVLESIRRCEEYKGRNLLYISGLNIDISEYQGAPPTSYFVPWAAHVQQAGAGGASPDDAHPVEQKDLFAALMAQSPTNPDRADLDENILRMQEAPRLEIRERG